jgi:hypothetical protein
MLLNVFFISFRVSCRVIISEKLMYSNNYIPYAAEEKLEFVSY